MSDYSFDQLKKKLGESGWRAVTESEAHPREGTLGQLAEAAHARHKSGQAAGYLQEIETKIEIGMVQLEDLWRHMGLPTI